jgi:hypothetical protein
MLKEVGASGQISLGKKYAGQLFDMVFHADGRVELVPMKAVPAVQEPAVAGAPGVQEEAAAYRIGDGWLTPERLARRKAAALRTPEEIEAARCQWEMENKEAIDAMNQHYVEVGSMGWRIYEWRKRQAASAAAEAPSSVDESRT